MAVKNLITDSKTGRQASVVSEGERNALVVATRSLKSYATKVKFFTNPNYGYNMNIVAGFSGTPEYIHNGIDNVYWTASTINGSWTFDSTTQAHTGTKSIDASETKDGHTAQIAKGSTIDLSGYISITGWVYLSFWDDQGTKGIQLYGWGISTGTIVGSEVNLKDHIDVGLLNIWQKFIVPLSTMNLVGETIDAIRIRAVDIGGGDPPDYYLDDIQIEETGAPVEFNIKPNSDTRLHVNDFNILLVDACSTTLADATMPYLSYDKFLGVSSLTNGILYQGIISGKIRFTIPFRNLGDFLMFPRFRIEGYGSDGTNTFLKLFMDLKYPIALQSECDDKLSFTLSDDLSGLLKLVITANCQEERR